MNKKLLKLKNQQDEIFFSIAGILGGFCAPVRIKLIHFLSQSPLAVDVLASKIDQSVANTSMHLRKMLTEKIVSVSVQGQKRIYSLHPATLEFWESCQNFVQKIDPSLELNVEEVYGPLAWPEDLETTIAMAKNKEVLLLDVRPSDEVAQDITGIDVLQMASSELSKKMSQIPKRKPVLVFCRGRLCALSAQAVMELRAQGIKAYRLNHSWYALKKAFKT